MPSIKDLSIFLCVSQSKSFSEAAVSLGMTPSAVGKVISRIENEYKTLLFKRNTRVISLTDDAKILLQHTENIISEINLSKKNLSEKKISYKRKLKIGMPNVDLLFSDVLLSFIKKYPDIDLEVNFDDSMSNIVKDGFDAVIRFGSIDDSRLFSKEIGEIKMGYFYSNNYHPANKKEDDTHIYYKYPSSGKVEVWEGFFDNNDDYTPKKYILDSIRMILEFCIDGRGIAFLPEAICHEYINNGILFQMNKESTPTRKISIVWADNKSSGVALRAFIDHFGNYFRKMSYLT